jgi:hypothetical protein
MQAVRDIRSYAESGSGTGFAVLGVRYVRKIRCIRLALQAEMRK